MRPAQRVSDEDIGTADGGGGKQPAEIFHNCPTRSKLRPRIFLARPKPGAVVRTNAGDLGDAGLDALPGRQRVPESGLQDYGRTSGAAAGHVKSPPADVHELVGQRAR